jgi:hypothetical protein
VHYPRRETRARSRKMNRNLVTIVWQFTRRKARMKFGYNRNDITRSVAQHDPERPT